MKKKSTIRQMPVNKATCRDCANARLVRTAPENPVLAQCALRPERFAHPHSNLVVNVASTPACEMFRLATTKRQVDNVDWREQESK